MNQDEALKEAHAYIDLYEKRTRQMPIAGLIFVLLGFFLFGHAIYDTYRACEIRQEYPSNNEKYNSTDSVEKVLNIVDYKIASLRYELSLKSETTLRVLIGGGFIGLGLGWYTNRKRRQKYSAMLRCLVNIIEEKNS